MMKWNNYSEFSRIISNTVKVQLNLQCFLKQKIETIDDFAYVNSLLLQE